MKRGLYIVFEGMTGVGKTVQSKLLFRKLKKLYPKKKVVWTIEPGGTEIARDIRDVVQRKVYKERMEPMAEAYLYAASRAQTLRKVVKPVLDRGGIVVSDRSIFTSLVYQGLGRGLGIDRVLKINREALNGTWPDIIVVIDTDPKIARERSHDQEGDKWERRGLDWWKKKRRYYSEVAKKYKKIVRVVDGRGVPDEVGKRVWEMVHGKIGV